MCPTQFTGKTSPSSEQSSKWPKSLNTALFDIGHFQIDSIFISILFLGSYRCLSAWCWCRYAYAWPSKFYHAASCLEFSLSRIEDYCDIGRCKIYSKRMGNLNMFSKSPCSFWKENVAYHRLFSMKI